MTSSMSSKICDHCNGYGNCPAGFSDSTICVTCDVRGHKSFSGRCRPCRGRGRIKGALEHQGSSFSGRNSHMTPGGVGPRLSPLAVQGAWTVGPSGYGALV